MSVPSVFAIDGVVRRYEWGSTTAIQSMLGLPVDGRPAAELWIGAHPGDPSRVVGSDDTLDALIARVPRAMLGSRVQDEFGDTLPFLLKVLAADKALSIQVHPNRDQAREGFERENAAGVDIDAPDRNYRDANHKPELICALTPFEALCGFRPVAETLALLDGLAIPELGFLAELLRGDDPLRAAFTALLTLEDPAPVVATVSARATENGPLRAAWLAAHDFPGDVGVLLTLLLNHVRLEPGEAIFLGAGNVHAYLRGTGVEIMANSDNVLRCGLTPKHIDVPELLRITDFSELADPRLPAQDGRFEVPVPDFVLTRSAAPSILDPIDGPSLVLCTSGSVAVDRGGSSVELAPGHAAYVPPGPGDCTLTGSGVVFRASA